MADNISRFGAYQESAGSAIASALMRAGHLILRRLAWRPFCFAGAGITLLHATGHDHYPEIWCRCDWGPRGHLGLGTHTRADALSVEVRYGGVNILADEIGGRREPAFGDPPPWSRHARAYHARARQVRSLDVRARGAEVIDDGDIAMWIAEHDSRLSLDQPVHYRRSVLLDRASRTVDIVDLIDSGSHDTCRAFRFGPDIQIELGESCALLRWPGSDTPGAARLELPLGLTWSLHRNDADTIVGWYAGRSVKRQPVLTLLGRGHCAAGTPLATRLEFTDPEKSLKTSVYRQVISWLASGDCWANGRDSRAEAR